LSFDGKIGEEETPHIMWIGDSMYTTAARKEGQQVGEHEERPCGRRMEEGVGILPFPETEKMGKRWTEREFWVNRAE
jgi:hypothetical protein